MGRYLVHQSDATAKPIREYLEANGAQVAAIGQPVDWAVGFLGLTVLAEVKTPTGPMRPKQRDFVMSWVGAIWVLRDLIDAREMLDLMRRWAKDISLGQMARPEGARFIADEVPGWIRAQDRERALQSLEPIREETLGEARRRRPRRRG